MPGIDETATIITADVRIIEETACHYVEPPRHDKIWAACYTDKGVYLAVYGKRNTTYNLVVKPYGSVADARAEYERKVHEKRHVKNYDVVEFGDVLHGNIPSFKLSSADGVISMSGVLRGLEALEARVKGGLEFVDARDVKAAAFHCFQLQAEAKLFVELSAATDTQIARVGAYARSIRSEMTALEL